VGEGWVMDVGGSCMLYRTPRGGLPACVRVRVRRVQAHRPVRSSTGRPASGAV
jgi:hypothetical protein